MSYPRYADREELAADQRVKLRCLLGELVASNAFYGPRIEAAGLDPESVTLDEFTARMTTTSKAEIVADQRRHPPYGSNLTYPMERYVRYSQTSGTTGEPMRWLDTAPSWDWMLDHWIRVFEAASVGRDDRVFFPFSFGAFLGFWTAFDAAVKMGCMTIPGGGMSSLARLRALADNSATAMCCTPTYAIRLAEVAAGEGLDLGELALAKIIVAGEPGGSVRAVREHIASLWPGARVFDHHGMTEVGPVSFPNPDFPGVLHVLEGSYVAEVVEPASGRPVAPGEIGELLLTTLGRHGSPLLRYHTGDLVKPSSRGAAQLGVPELALEGGILARTDDMVVVRGVNLFPSAVEEVIRGESGVAEFQIELTASGPLAEVRVRLEPRPGVDAARLARRLETALRLAFALRIPVEPVAHGSLPRFELKAKRWRRV